MIRLPRSLSCHQQVAFVPFGPQIIENVLPLDFFDPFLFSKTPCHLRYIIHMTGTPFLNEKICLDHSLTTTTDTIIWPGSITVDWKSRKHVIVNNERTYTNGNFYLSSRYNHIEI